MPDSPTHSIRFHASRLSTYLDWLLGMKQADIRKRGKHLGVCRVRALIAVPLPQVWEFLIKPENRLAGMPPAEERSKGRVEQPDIQTENDDATRNGCPGGDRLVHQRTHEIAATRKHHQGDDR